MAWQPITNNAYWEYDDAPPDPGGKQSVLWATGVNGIRTDIWNHEIYMNCRLIGRTTASVPSELSKTYWDAQV